MPFKFSFPEYLSHHRTRKNRVSPVSPAHMNSPLLGHCLPGYLPSNASAICIEFTPCPWAFIDIILSEFQRINLSYVRQHNIKYQVYSKL